MINYQHVFNAAKLAAFSGEHVLLLGAPGTGKSQFSREFFSQFEGEKFSTQLSRWSDETILFGPPDIAALRKGDLRYKRAGLLSAAWAFIDEIFDASDVLLRTLLGVLNERRFDRGDFSVKVPLRSCIAAANYSRVNETTEAVIDRFLVRMEAPSLAQKDRLALWGQRLPGNGVEGVTTLEQIDAVQASARSVKIPDAVARLGNEYAAKLAFSPRRERKAARMVRISAALAGRETATGEDLVAVLPLLISLGEKLSERQAELRAELAKHSRRLNEEEKQIEYIQQRRAVCDVDYGNTLERARAISKAMREMQSLYPASDAVDQERMNAENELKEAHSECLRRLELI